MRARRYLLECDSHERTHQQLIDDEAHEKVRKDGERSGVLHDLGQRVRVVGNGEGKNDDVHEGGAHA